MVSQLGIQPEMDPGCQLAVSLPSNAVHEVGLHPRVPLCGTPDSRGRSGADKFLVRDFSRAIFAIIERVEIEVVRMGLKEGSFNTPVVA